MGIDIYARWKGQTEEEKNAQYEAFSVVHGRFGYLREAYYGPPYATMFLCQEAFATLGGQADIPAAVLRERLPQTILLVREREREIYGVTDEKQIAEVIQSFSDFVSLCERKEAESGRPVRISASY
jgi:hypothetical protein